MHEQDPTKSIGKSPAGKSEPMSVKNESLEKLEKELDPYVREILRRWEGEDGARRAGVLMQPIALDKINYPTVAQTRASLFGQYTINPDMVGVDFKEKELKLKILNEELKNFVNKPRSAVLEYVVKNYGEQYNIPGFEYQKYLSDNLEKIPAELKDGKKYYLIGSTLRTQDGRCVVSCFYFAGRWLVDSKASWLDKKWEDSDRIVLLEK